jgi:hypothetical protein
MIRRALAGCVVLAHLVATTAGCASAPPLLGEDFRDRTEALQLHPATVAQGGWRLDAREVEAMSAAAGALAGGTTGALSVGNALSGSCEGSVCGAVALVWLTAVATGALVGAVAGATQSQREGAELARVEDLRGTFEQVARDLGACARLDEALRVALRDVAPHALVAMDAGAPAVLFVAGVPAPAEFALDVQLRDVSFEKVAAADGTPRFQLSVLVRYRLNAHAGGTPRYESFAYATRGPHDFQTWAADGARVLVAALTQIERQIAETIVDDVLRVYRSADSSAPASEYRRGYFLDAMYPKTLTGFRPFSSDARLVGLGGAYAVEIDETQPLLRWTSVPHRLGGGRQRETIDVPRGELRYDVRLFDGVSEIERADGLTRPQYPVHAALEACRVYFWTFRARFERAGRIRVTDWSGVYTGLEAWNSRYPLIPGVAEGRDEPSGFQERTLYYHRFWVRGPGCG